MIRSIEEIRKRKEQGKRKWGNDLALFLMPFFDAGRTYEEVVLILKNEYNFSLSSGALRVIMAKFKKNDYKPEKDKEQVKKEIVQNKEAIQGLSDEDVTIHFVQSTKKEEKMVDAFEKFKK